MAKNNGVQPIYYIFCVKKYTVETDKTFPSKGEEEVLRWGKICLVYYQEATKRPLEQIDYLCGT